jgi:hypothetical protein
MLTEFGRFRPFAPHDRQTGYRYGRSQRWRRALSENYKRFAGFAFAGSGAVSGNIVSAWIA